ncbi:hypothetical protein ACS0TY_005320 [Phlomoides rotata]
MSNPPPQTMSNSPPPFFKVGVAVVATGGLLVLATIVVRCICSARRAWRAKVLELPSTTIQVWEVDAPTMERFFHELAQEKPVRFSAQQLRSFTKNYATVLGSGGFGKVYKGKFPNGIKIAVKVLNRSPNGHFEQQFMAEVGTIGRTNHINCVRLYGFCYDHSMSALVYEFMENGSLDRHLFVADFGMAKLCNRDDTHVSITGGFRGTPGYAAPEFMLNNFPITHKCDVYSFGILLFEIMGRRKHTRVVGSDESLDWFPKKV